MPADSVITLERFNESHIEGITALYNDPAVARQAVSYTHLTLPTKA